MADSNFWEGLATQFRELDPRGELRADMDSPDTGLGTWQITDRSSPSSPKGRDEDLPLRFERLASRAGAKIACSGYLPAYPFPDDHYLRIWLELLQFSSPNFQFGREWREAGVRHITGHIKNVSDASANLYAELASLFSSLCRQSGGNYSVDRCGPLFWALGGAGGLVSSCIAVSTMLAELRRGMEGMEIGPRWKMIEAAPSSRGTQEQRPLVESRAELLSDYKAATGISADASIYNARQHSMHKAQFYQWRKGILSGGCATSVSFGRFLREQNPPIPR